MTKLRMFLIAAILLVAISPLAIADYVVTRAYRSATNAEFERLFLSEVTRNGGAITVGAAIELNAPLLDHQRIWALSPIASQNQVVYGVFDPNDNSLLDALFVVSLRKPSQPTQLSQVRSSPATQFITGYVSNGQDPRIVYTQQDSSTNIETLYSVDTRNPGRASVLATLAPGETTGEAFRLSPDGSVVAYNVIRESGSQQVRVSFLNQEANSTVVHTDTSLTNYRPAEFAFSDDSARLFWLDNGTQSEAGPLQSVAVDALAATVGSVVQVSAGDLVNERVSEFAVKPGSNTEIAYRGFAADSLAPSNTYYVDLATPGSTVQLNNGPFRGAAFMTWEDVEWRGDQVLYNSTEDDVLRADLFSVASSDPGNTTLLSRQVPFSPDRAGSKASGIAHIVQSSDGNKTAMIDGDPSVNVFVIDRFNLGTSFAPFNINSNRTLDSSTDPSELPPTFNAGGDMIAMVISESLPNQSATNNLYVASSATTSSEQPILSTESPTVFDHAWFSADAIPASEPTAMAAAVLPASRSGQVGATLTAFVTLINGGGVTAENCTIDLIANIPATLSYQTTNPATNAPTGTADTPVSIAPGEAQSFVISIDLAAQFAPVDAPIAYSCLNADTVTPLSGLNTLLLSASSTPVPDVIALAATATGDGIARLDNSGNGAFSVASVNVGASANINVSATTSTGAQVALCQSDPATAACINPQSPTFGEVSVEITSDATPTFSVFASSTGSIASNAATNRVSVVFEDSAGNVRGQTSVAIQTAQ